MEPVFFLVRRTARQVRLIPALEFNFEDGTYTPVSRRHPRADEITAIMTMFEMVAMKMDPNRLDAAKLVEAAEPFFKGSRLTCRLLAARGKLPARIIVRAAD